MNGSRWQVLPLLLALAACEEAEAVRVQPLPPLRQITPEERAGLPTVAGAWRLAGWEVRDSAGLAPDSGFARIGVVAVEHQRLDSVAGFYAMGDARAPLFGEVRRDSVVALVVLPAPGRGGVLSGRVSGDTLWIEIASIPGTENWPRGARAALVRGNVATPFVRIAGAPPVLPVDTMADSLRLDSLRTDSLGVPAVRPAPLPGTRPTGQPVGPEQQRPSVTPGQPAPGRPAPDREPRRLPSERPETTQPPPPRQQPQPRQEPRAPEPQRERPTDTTPRAPEPRRERPADTTPRAPEPRVLPAPQVEPVQPPPRPDVDLPPELR